MPRYEYACVCGERVLRVCTMGEIPTAVSCGKCCGEAKRVYSAPQVKTASLYSEANRRGLTELEATRRTDEQIYARNWNRSLPGL